MLNRRRYGKPVTFMQRVKASKVVGKLWDQHATKWIGADLGIRPAYVVWAKDLTKKPREGSWELEEGFMCPKWAIWRILEWEATHAEAINLPR